MSEEFIKEVDEDLKEEKDYNYGKNSFHMCWIFFRIILITSGFVFWQNYTTNTNQTLGDDYICCRPC